MIVCVTCGNKRCPHAANHRHACTNSNEPGQPSDAGKVSREGIIDEPANETPQERAMREGAALLADVQTGLTRMEEAGWTLECNMGGNTYFRHDPTRGVLSIPWWAAQMISNAAKQADENAKRSIREAIGIETL